MLTTTNRARLWLLAKKHRILTTREVAAAGIHRQTLTNMVREGGIERIGRGRYRLGTQPTTENHSLAIVASVAPNAVVCLLSALQFHGIGTQVPFQVWIALEGRARQPRLGHPPLRVVRFTGQAFRAGIREHLIEGQTVRVYSPAKTLADLFKYRNKVGLDVALEALREGWRARRFTLAEIDRYAKVCRVERVMRPYLQSLIG